MPPRSAAPRPAAARLPPPSAEPSAISTVAIDCRVAAPDANPGTQTPNAAADGGPSGGVDQCLARYDHLARGREADEVDGADIFRRAGVIGRDGAAADLRGA